MRIPHILALTCLLASGLVALVRSAELEPAKACPKCAETGAAADAAAQESFESLKLPDVQLTDQRGTKVRLVSELLRGKIAVVNFVFTSCPTICPLQGASFGKLQSLLGPESSNDVLLVSVSLDPLTDTPERLRAWAKRFDAGPNWTLMTGAKADVDKVLRAFQIPVADKTTHQPLVMVGDAQGQWTRINGLAAPAQIAGLVSRLRSGSPRSATAATAALSTGKEAAPAVSPAQRYFSDVLLIDQDGKERRLYTDLLRQKVVVINSFFASCQGSCPIMLSTLSRLQEHLGEHVGKDVCLISISVDPDNDTPERLKAYAAHLQARPGWYFLTGNKENVNFALAKLGQLAETREQHSSLFIVGNESTGLWKKAFGLAKPEEIVQLVDGVLNDNVPTVPKDTDVATPSGGKL
jgi:cytochrome oxidase Cu insertion factor (SCO1/SenC/PrrC family)